MHSLSSFLNNKKFLSPTSLPLPIVYVVPRDVRARVAPIHGARDRAPRDVCAPRAPSPPALAVRAP